MTADVVLCCFVTDGCVNEQLYSKNFSILTNVHGNWTLPSCGQNVFDANVRTYFLNDCFFYYS